MGSAARARRSAWRSAAGYARDRSEKLDPLNPKPALHVKTTLHVRRLTPKEVYDDRGWEREPGV